MFSPFPFPDQICVPGTDAEAVVRRENAFVSAIHYISQTSFEYKLAMWTAHLGDGKRSRVTVPLGPGDTRFRGLDPNIGDELSRYKPR